MQYPIIKALNKGMRLQTETLPTIEANIVRLQRERERIAIIIVGGGGVVREICNGIPH